MFAFDLNGGIYACETTAGRPEYQIGTFTPELSLNRELMKALNERNILNIPECRKCPQALLCAGGCTFQAVVTRGSLLSPGCRMLKETLQYGLDYYWPEIKERLESQVVSEEQGTATENACCDSTEQNVMGFYAAAAESPIDNLCCPPKYDEALTSFIPDQVLARSYGCGSPVHEARIAEGSVVVDLGCGAGIDAFLAAKDVGPKGQVIGIDMTQEMLEQARLYSVEVTERLGYDAVEFKQGRLEAIPLEDNTADVVLSNCVLNLSPDKGQVLREIFRVLKPGGRFVISDILADRHVPDELRQNPDLRNRCISGSASFTEFVNPAREAGFVGVNFKVENVWQEVASVRFYPAIIKGFKPQKSGECVYKGQRAVYGGPFSTASDDEGHVFARGVPVEVCTDTARALTREPYASTFVIIEPEASVSSSCCTGNNGSRC